MPRLLVFAIFWLAAACQCFTPAKGLLQAATNVEEGNRTQTLHIGTFSDPDTLDPQLVNNRQVAAILFALLEGLTVYDPATCEPRPGVATHWHPSDDGLTWTFHLRPDARWSNGDPVTAHDFVFSFQRLLSPQLASDWANLLYCLKNARDFNGGKFPDTQAIGVRAIDDHTLVLELEHPVPHLPAILCHNACLPVHRATLERHAEGDALKRGTAWMRPGNLVGNGPFTLVEWRGHQLVRLAPNPTYWDRQAVRLAAIVFHIVENEDTEERMFRAGQLHMTSTLSPAKVEAYKRDPRGVYIATPYFATYYYYFNATRKPFDDTRVRRAFAMAINRKQITSHIMRGGQSPATHVCPPGIEGFAPEATIPYDPAAARALLAEAGYPEGKGFPKTELLFFHSVTGRMLSETVQEMWRRELGIKVSLRSLDPAVFYNTVQQLDYQIAATGGTGDYLDPSTMLDNFSALDGPNLIGWKNAGYDQLVAEAQTSADQQHRYQLYEQCEQILADEGPVAPVYFYMANNLRLPCVKGWQSNPLNIRLFKSVWLEE